METSKKKLCFVQILNIRDGSVCTIHGILSLHLQYLRIDNDELIQGLSIEF